MKRTLEQWQGCNPATMMEGMSKRGVIRTLEEAKADILELHAEMERSKKAITICPNCLMVHEVDG